jgi:iron complex transport system permease protein
MNVRFPRVIAALLAGSGLAVAGALIQAVLDNPLASPNIIVSILEQDWRYCWLVHCFPVGCSCLPWHFHRCLDKRADHLWHLVWHPMSRLTVVLAGIAVSSIIGAGMNTILIIDPNAYIALRDFWLVALWSWWLPYYLAKCLHHHRLDTGIIVQLTLNIMALGDATRMPWV